MKKVSFDKNLSELLCIDQELQEIRYVKRMKSPTTYFIHCDLVDKEQNLLNGKPSTVLQTFDIKGKPYEKKKIENINMASNVLPSAPTYGETETQTTLYPVLPTEPDNNFRMQKVNEVLKYLIDEVSHYRLVPKKYKRTKTIINYANFCAGGVSGTLSAGSVAAAFTVIGVPASIPLAVSPLSLA